MSKMDLEVNGKILPEPQFKRIPIKVDSKTTLYIRADQDIEKHIKAYKERKTDPIYF